MLKIDDNLLQEIGLGSLPTEEKRGLLSHIYETLEMRVGMRLADQMSNEQLDEFEQYFEAKDDAGAFKWLEANFPNYKDIVNEEFEKLKGEVGSTASQILQASQQNLAAHPLQPQIPQQPAADSYQQAPAPAYQPQVAPTQPAYQPPQPQYAPPAPAPQPYAQPQPVPAPQYQQPVPQQPFVSPQPAAPQPPFPPQQPPAGPGSQQ